jgi:hypothetical protein
MSFCDGKEDFETVLSLKTCENSIKKKKTIITITIMSTILNMY